MTRDQQKVLAICVFAVALTGCGNVIAWFPVLVLALSLALSACLESDPLPPSDAGSEPGDGGLDASPSEAGQQEAGPDASGSEAGQQDAGSWGPCCENGRIESCFCPAGWACNYGWYSSCGNGTCINYPDAALCPHPDAGANDGGPDGDAGSWSKCCLNGRVDTCFCPAAVACNYGWFTDCGDGACVDGVFPADAAVVCVQADAGAEAGL